MSILLRHIIRTIKENRLGSFVIIISLSISTAVVYLNFNINSDLLSVAKNLFEGIYGGYDLVVSDTEDDLIYDEAYLRRVDTLPVTYSSGKCNSLKAGMNISAYVICSDWDSALERNIVSFEQGTMPSGTNSVAISRNEADYYGIHIGENIEVYSDDNGKKYTFTVSGIFSSIGIFADERSDTLELLLPFEEKYGANEIYIDTDDIKNEEDFVNRLQNDNPKWTIEYTYKDSSSIRHLDDIKHILYLLISMSVIIAYFVISSVSKLMLESRMPVTGTLRSIGASRKTINFLLMTENVIYGIVGGALGIALGELLRILTVRLYYNVSDSQHTLNILFVLGSLIFAILVQASITFITLKKTNIKSIRNVISQTTAVAVKYSPLLTRFSVASIITAYFLHLTNNDFNFIINLIALVLAIIGCIGILPFIIQFITKFFERKTFEHGRGTLFIALKYFSSSKTDLSSTILTAVVTALAMVILICTISVSHYFDEYTKNYDYDILIKCLNEPVESYYFIDEIEGISGVNSEFWDFREIKLNDENTKVCFVRRHGYSNGITMNDVSEDSLKTGHTLIDQIFAAKHSINIGDTIKISDGDYSYELIIDGICDSGIFSSRRNCLILTEKDYDKYVELSPALVGIDLNDISSEENVMSELSNRIYEETGETANVYSKNEYIGKELDNVKNAVLVFSVIPAMTVFLAILGLINNQLVTYNRKKREYAVLYSVSMSRRQLGKMVYLELILVFFFGSFYGLLTSLWLVNIVRDIIFGLIAYVDIKYDCLRILEILLLTFALLCVFAKIPERIVRKTNIVEDIKYE